MNKLAQISAISIAASAGFATAGSLDLDRSYASELRSDAGAYSVLNSQPTNIAISAGVRFGYAVNIRDNSTLGDDEDTFGFGFQEAEVRLSGQVTDSINATVSFDFGPDDTGFSAIGSDSGTAELEDAYADWAINDGFNLRVGQFVQAFSAGRSVSEFHMMNAFRSATELSLGDTDWTQGIEAHFGGDTWAAAVGFNDGPRSANSAFNGSAEADYALNGRFDFFSDSNKERFNDRAAWRGQEAGWRVGAGAIFASYGDTNPSTVADTATIWYTVDAAYEGDGWGVNAAFFGQNIDTDGVPTVDNHGFEIGANMFFTDQVEGFARWDTLLLEDDLAGTTEDTFNFLSGGINYYLVPESHAAKMTFEVGYAFDDSRGATDPTFANGIGGFLGDSDEGELTFAAMMQFLF
jgi:hypothetical protein